MMKKAHLKESEYAVKEGHVIEAKQMTSVERYFKIGLEQEDALDHEPGQFVMIGLPGIGEVPISVSSSPTKRDYFELVIRKEGKVTSVLHRLKAGDNVSIRGPFGHGFPVKILVGNDLLFVAGGLGIVPLRSLINFVIDNRRDFGKVDILLGCKTPRDMLFGEEVLEWSRRLDVNFSCTVDRADPDWKGNIGLITSLLPGVTLDADRTFAVVVGPPIMYKFVIKELVKKRIPDRQIIVSLERHMKCGVGKCGHCQIGNYYCCQDGPVFSYDKIKYNLEAL